MLRKNTGPGLGQLAFVAVLASCTVEDGDGAGDGDEVVDDDGGEAETTGDDGEQDTEDVDSTTGENPGNCNADVEYPAGPYGFEKDQIIANFQFQGFEDGVGPLTDMCLSDYYDPDGSRGIRALYLTRGHILCGACVQEAPNINEWKATYAPYGAAFLSVLWAGSKQDANGLFPINESELMVWIDEFDVTYDLAMDPEILLAGGVEPPTDPIGWLIDTRTMKIYHTYGGAPGFLQYMPELLEQNGAMDVPP